MKNILILHILISITFYLSAQKVERNHFYFQSRAIYGKPIIYSDSLSSELVNNYKAIDFRFGIQTNGENNTDQFLGFYKYGFGIYHANLNNKDTLGNPWAAYIYYNAPIFRHKKFQFNYDLGLGMAWNFTAYDKYQNPRNDLIGGNPTAYFSLGLDIAYRINNRFIIDVGYSLTHFSNGAMQTPNKGMNLHGGNLGLSYFFSKNKNANYLFPDFKRNDIGEVKKHHEIDLNYSLGGKTTNRKYGRGPEYFCSTFTLNYYRRFHWIGKFGGGMDLLFDSSLKEYYDSEVDIYKFISIGAHANYELMISKVSLIGQLGTYIHKETPGKGNFYFRVGIKYYVISNLYTFLNLKTANGFIADYIEFGMGYGIVFKK